MPMQIVPVPAFTDNYIWLVHDSESGDTAVVDPGDAAPALAEAERRGWRPPRPPAGLALIRASSPHMQA